LQSKHLIQFQRISRYFYHRKYSWKTMGFAEFWRVISSKIPEN
jgi:hypothetical protein